MKLSTFLEEKGTLSYILNLRTKIYPPGGFLMLLSFNRTYACPWWSCLPAWLLVWYQLSLFSCLMMMIFVFFLFFITSFLFTLPDQAGILVPWRTLGISPHGKYYNPLPFSPWADNTANKHLYRMCVSFTPVPIKNYKQRRTATFYYDPPGTAEAPRWRRSDICPDNTGYYLRRG